MTVCEQITDIDGLKTVFLCKLDWGGWEKNAPTLISRMDPVLQVERD